LLAELVFDGSVIGMGDFEPGHDERRGGA
jgi:hypothetical protein